MYSDHASSRSRMSYFISRISKSFRHSSTSRKLICLILILNLLTWPGADFALRQLPLIAAAAFDLTADSLGRASMLMKRVLAAAAAAPKQETMEDRHAQVARVRITPSKFVGYEGQAVTFSALGTDLYDRAIQGVKLTWQSSDADKILIDEAGRATFLKPGLATISCRAGAAQATAPVLIRPGRRPLQTDAQWLADQARLSADGGITGGPGASASLIPSLLEHLSPTAHAQGGIVQPDFAYDEMWSEPRNLVGLPPHRAIEPTRLGPVLPEGSNFEFAVPIADLGGRGISASLMLHYNSRVWTQRGNTVTFDPLRGWPFAGFSLGFGHIVTYGEPTSKKFVLVDPDGTLHYLGSGNGNVASVYQTSDGTHITYVGDAVYGGMLRFNDGTKVTISVVNNRLLPTQITDPNGNYIQIAYKNSSEGYPAQAIDYVRDTLGRVISFFYDSSFSLRRIEVPAVGGTSQNPLTRKIYFGYQDRSLTFNFNWFSTFTENTTYGQSLRALRQVYFAETQTGHRFDYSDYGMIYNTSSRRQMSISFASDPLGVIGDGVESASVSFNYPTSGSTMIDDAPAFTQRTESGTGTPSGTHSYSTSTDAGAQTMTFTISRPDSSQLLLTRSTNGASVANGLLVQSEVKSGSASFAKNIFSYANDAGGSVQVQSVTGFDDAVPPNQTKVDFDYDQYGNVTNQREYGFQENGNWQVRRRTQLTYKTDSAYVNEYLRRLITEAAVYDANNVMLARTAFTYDDYAAMGGMENYGGSAAPPGHLSSHRNTALTVRGNTTGVTQWTDMAANTSISRLMKLDYFGNVVKAQVSCCNQRSFTFAQDTYWTSPQSVTSGDPAGVHLTSTMAYDFNTLAVTSETDPNNLTTSYSYDLATRLTQTTFATGATQTTSYNDGALSVSTSLNFVERGVNRTAITSAVFGGWGQPTQSVNIHGGQVNITYDSMGRVQSRTNPFQHGGQPGPSTSYQYDALGRVKKKTLPNGNTLQSTYSGAATTGTDQVSRKMQGQVDGLARLVKVTEQNASGVLAQETGYTYDLLDRLTQVSQGGQLRAYKYDALGRLMFERTPEQSATINDGTGQMWSVKYTYTDFHAVESRTDSRGVVTTYGYDELHRLTSITYDTSNAPAVATTPSVTYNYDRTSNSSTKGLLLSVVVGSGYREDYSYDGFNRVSSLTKRIEASNYTTSYQYNTANQLSEIIYPSGRVVKQNHDSIGRLSSVTDTLLNPYLSQIAYSPAGQVTGWTLGNNVSESFSYDSQTLQMTGQTATRSGTQLLSLTYGYNAQAGQMGQGTTAGNAGQLTSVTGTINGQAESASYTYDLLGRLVTANQTSNAVSAQRRYEYDQWGNRTAVWNATSGGTQIQAISLQQSGGVPTNRVNTITTNGQTLNCTYDPAGNVTNDGALSFSYDAESRVVSVNGGLSGQYSYDAANRRVKKAAGAVTTHYIWEGGQMIAEYSTSGGWVDYIYAGSKMVARYFSMNQIRYFINDRLGVRLILDNGGNVVGRQTTLTYGEEVGSSGESDKHKFTSYERDAETGLDYAVNRFYSSSTDRFYSADKVRGNVFNPQRLNRYSYTRNDPVNRVDRLGLEDSRCFTDPETGEEVCGPAEVIDVPAGDDSFIDPFDLLPGGGLIDFEVFSEQPSFPNPDAGGVVILEPEPLPTPKTKVQKIVNKATNRAYRALKSDKCKDVVRGNIPRESIRTVVRGLKRGGFIQPSSEHAGNPAEAVFDRATGEFKRIDVHNSFFTRSGRLAGEGTQFPRNLSLKDWQTLIILHEVGHATGADAHGPRDPLKEAEYNARVYQNCIK
jgi:RHS repeat-associated protein